MILDVKINWNRNKNKKQAGVYRWKLNFSTGNTYKAKMVDVFETDHHFICSAEWYSMDVDVVPAPHCHLLGCR